jgi:hypothetical protein
MLIVYFNFNNVLIIFNKKWLDLINQDFKMAQSSLNSSSADIRVKRINIGIPSLFIKLMIAI